MLQVKSKFKIGKRLGASVFEKCQTQRFALSEARTQKNKKRRGSLSDYGKQLIEKQKMRFTYGLTERQFARYVKEAMEAAQPAHELAKILETRLDNVLYRMNIAPTRRAARQMVSHGHFTVNGKRMNVPSHAVRVGDSVAVREGSKGHGLFAGLAEKDMPALPSWVSFDYATLKGAVTALPVYTPGDGSLDIAAVLEFYSR